MLSFGHYFDTVLIFFTDTMDRKTVRPLMFPIVLPPRRTLEGLDIFMVPTGGDVS